MLSQQEPTYIRSLSDAELFERVAQILRFQQSLCDRRADAIESVYFIRSDCPNRFIKIGAAVDVPSRLKGLQTSSAYPLSLLATISGGLEREHSLHRQFAHLRVRGEWFHPAPELMTLIRSIQCRSVQ